MTIMFGRKLSAPALTLTATATIVVNSIGLAQEWWTGILPNVIVMLAVAFGAGWLFGSPVKADPS